ncbi:DUF7344 domain-containing protein [Halorubrum vacuolatum]|uniref:DUF7344 domain-containing protein n=1 Tax=Halorubrum vacuolatum TaxID=63740 RepID=A0A238XBA8_HALVU|nr:hypothetical protein [Halorubrum vacuolatum]SNR55159.1 hypothetical protein SAMN06264855_11480 [Halorubrum vacuolatum]
MKQRIVYSTMGKENSDPNASHKFSGGTDGSIPTNEPPSLSKPPVPSASNQEVDEMPLDDLFDVLRNSRRRRVLRYLFTKDDRTATVGELSEQVASIEQDVEVTLITSKQRKRVYIGLYQTHLPKLADLGLIEYNRGRGVVTLLSQADQVEPYLFVVQEKASWKWWISAVLVLSYSIVVGIIAINYSVVASIISVMITAGVFLGAMFYWRRSLRL